MPKRSELVRNFASRLILASLGAVTAATALAQSSPKELRLEQAIRLSPFGERAAFSPDGTRIAFVGKSYGDAYEIEITTGTIRNLTRNIPHQGVVRIQYLPRGDYLVTAAHRYMGANSRANLEMWVLDKSLEKALQPLGEKPFEGVAVARTRNLIAWTAIEPDLSLKQGDNWRAAFSRPTKRYVAEIAYESGVPRIANKREIMAKLPKECGFVEPQDFRDSQNELVFSCLGAGPGGVPLISVMGYKMDSGKFVTYRRKSDEYNEAEGISPDGSWTTVECGKQSGPGLPALDICRLELRPDGTMTRLIVGTMPSSTRHISNSVVSPDGRWVALQAGDSTVGEEGEGLGIYLMRTAD